MSNAWFREDGSVGGPAHLDSEIVRQREEELRAAFKSGYGKRALILNLANLCFFRETLTDEEVNLCNMAKRQLGQMGIWLPGNEEKIVTALMKVTRPDEGEEE